MAEHPTESDPFTHHPELRDKIKDPLTSFFRDFHPSQLDEVMAAGGLPKDWRTSDAEREASRQRTLAGHEGDLWVFAYGSLLWDPAILFAEVRAAHVQGYARRFCLKDTFGGRGSAEAPGLMAGLDEGKSCGGLAFRVAAERVEEESMRLWRRELAMPAYVPTFLRAETAQGDVQALAFVADHSAKVIVRDLSHEQQVRYIASGKGFLGTSLAYVEELASYLRALSIEDEELFALLAEAKALAAATHDGPEPARS